MLKKISSKIKQLDYKFLIMNLLIIISYVLILSVFGLHGHDDEYAYTYYTNPDITFLEKIWQILTRGKGWNIRVGEILYFIFGAFPLWVSYIMHSLIMITFINLVVYYALGYKKYKEKKNVNILLLITYLIFMIVNPVIAEVFFWSGGIFNHLFSAVIILLVGIPYRNIIDGKEELTQYNKKYILYLLICLVAGFGVESTVPTLIVGMFIVNFVLFLKNKKVDKFKLMPLIVLCVSFFIFLLLSKHRIEFQATKDFSTYSKANMLSLFMANRWLQIVFLMCISLVYLIIFKLKNFNDLKKRLYILLISITSFLAMLISPYYVDRGVFMLDVGIAILVIYMIHMIISKIKNRYILFSITGVLFSIMICITLVYRNLYIDYNKYCDARNNYILNQLKNGESFVFYKYKTNKKFIIYKLKERLIDIAEGNASTPETINFKYNYNGDFTVDWEGDKFGLYMQNQK